MSSLRRSQSSYCRDNLLSLSFWSESDCSIFTMLRAVAAASSDDGAQFAARQASWLRRWRHPVVSLSKPTEPGCWLVWFRKTFGCRRSKMRHRLPSNLSIQTSFPVGRADVASAFAFTFHGILDKKPVVTTVERCSSAMCTKSPQKNSKNSVQHLARRLSKFKNDTNVLPHTWSSQ